MKARLILAALALAAPANAPAAVAPVAAPTSDLDRLVLLLVPDQRLLDMTLQAVRNETAKSPEFARDPALADFVIQRMWPEVSKTLREKLPELRAELAKVIEASLTPEEISDVYAFYTSPTGQKMQRIMFEVITEHPGASLADQQRMTVERFMAALTPDDYGPLGQFGASSAATKMQDLTPRLTATSQAWVTRVLGQEDARMAALRNQAIADYRRDHPESAK